MSPSLALLKLERLYRVCWLLRLSVPKMTGAGHVEHLLAHEVTQVATCVYLYFKLPSGDKGKCTH